MRNWDFRRLMAVALVLTTAVVTMPLSAADFSTARPVLGSVSAVGSVELRGVGISQDGTLFSGDSIRSNAKGYAKVLIGTGAKLELSEKTDVRINRDDKGIQIAMNSGSMAFTALTPLRVDVAPFEVTASDDASGVVAFTGTAVAGVRAINGKVTVRNLKTSESFVLTKGHEQLLGLSNGAHGPSLGEIATNVPAPLPGVPDPAPQTPAGKTTGGLAMDTGAWLAVIGGAAIGAIAIWGVVSARRANNRIDNLTGQLATTNQNLAIANVNSANNAAATAAQIKALQSAQASSNAALQAQILALQLQNGAAGVQTAVNAAANLSPTQRGNLTAQAAALQGQISSAASTISQLQNQLQSLTTQLNGATGPQALAIQNQINTVTASLNGSITTLNNAIANLNTLIASAVNSGVPNVPNVTIQPVTPAPTGSASVPA